MAKVVYDKEIQDDMEEAWWLMAMISKHLRRLPYTDGKHYINPLPSEAFLKNEMQDDTKKSMSRVVQLAERGLCGFMPRCRSSSSTQLPGKA